MRRTAATVFVYFAVASFCAHAGNTPEWDRLKSCFVINLAILFRSNKQVDAVFRAARAICDDAIDDALEQGFAKIRASSDPPDNRYEEAMMVRFILRKIERVLFAYAVKFKAVGGPTTLAEP
jgi:hypothetical protein